MAKIRKYASATEDLFGKMGEISHDVKNVFSLLRPVTDFVTVITGVPILVHINFQKYVMIGKSKMSFLARNEGVHCNFFVAKCNHLEL